MRLPSLSLVVALAACGGTSYVTSVTDEPPGANCANGGVRIDSGPDDNDDGDVTGTEIEDTHYVCNGSGQSTLVNVTSEPAGANCAAGGAKIETGPDGNGNGTLEANEVASTSYVCGAGAAQVVKTFANPPNGIDANTGAAATIHSAQITVTGPGRLLAYGSVDLYCTAAQCPAANNPPAAGYFWVSTVDNLGVPSTEYDHFFLTPNVTESLTRSLAFTFTAGGTYTIYMRGQDLMGDFTWYRPSLTLVFLPGAM